MKYFNYRLTAGIKFQVGRIEFESELSGNCSKQDSSFVRSLVRRAEVERNDVQNSHELFMNFSRVDSVLVSGREQRSLLPELRVSDPEQSLSMP